MTFLKKLNYIVGRGEKESAKHAAQDIIGKTRGAKLGGKTKPGEGLREVGNYM